MVVRFTTAPTEASCNTCCLSFRDKGKWRAATWFVYFGNHNAVPMCARHAIFELGWLWSIGDTITVNGQPYEPPAPLLEAFQREEEQAKP